MTSIAQYQTTDIFKTIVCRVNASLAFLEAVETGQLRLPIQTCATVLKCQLEVLRQYDTIRGWFSRKEKKEAGACDDRVFHVKLLKTADMLLNVENNMKAQVSALLLSTNTWISKAQEAEQSLRLEDAENYYSRGLQALSELLKYKVPDTTNCKDCARTVAAQNTILKRLEKLRKVLEERSVLQTAIVCAA
jgi:hypothetical protein